MASSSIPEVPTGDGHAVDAKMQDEGHTCPNKEADENASTVGIGLSSLVFERLHPEKHIPGHTRAGDDEGLLPYVKKLASETFLFDPPLLDGMRESYHIEVIHTAAKAVLALYEQPSDSLSQEGRPSRPDTRSFIHSFSEKFPMNVVHLDAILALALLDGNRPTHESVPIGNVIPYLQDLSAISATAQHPDLRFRAHVAVIDILRWVHSEATKFLLIKQTLEHPAYDNLRVSAVEWLKIELLAACNSDDPDLWCFNSTIVLDGLAPLLFPDLRIYSDMPLQERGYAIAPGAAFYLATLNLYYLMLKEPEIAANLEVTTMHKELDVEERYLTPLRKFVSENLDLSADGLPSEDGGHVGNKIMLWLLEDALGRVDTALGKEKNVLQTMGVELGNLSLSSQQE